MQGSRVIDHHGSTKSKDNLLDQSKNGKDITLNIRKHTKRWSWVNVLLEELKLNKHLQRIQSSMLNVHCHVIIRNT